MGENPFCQEFEYGTSSGVHWTYYPTVLQVEDCTNILKALHPGIHFIFIFDHPYRHGREIEDRLNAMKMNSGYVGAQLEILPTNIKQEVGCLGPHEKVLEVGDENNMLSQEGGNVPIWMTPQERVATKFSQCDEL